MKVSHEEFNRFWDEVLGDDWYLDEGDVDEKDPVVDLSELVVVWQGSGSPKAKGIITARDVDSGASTVLDAKTLYRRWKKTKSTTVVMASFEVPNEKVDELLKQIKELKGKVLR